MATTIVAGNALIDSISLLADNGNRTFAALSGSDLPTQSYPAALAIGDVDEDGRPDVVTG